MKKYYAEMIGTFALVFCGTGAIIINNESHGAITNLGIAISFGLIVMVMIYAFGSVSGAHLNPAVTLAFASAGLSSKKEILPYIAAQLIGALIASSTLHFLFPHDLTLGTTQPSGAAWQSFVLEFALTFILMLVILLTSQGIKEVRKFVGLIVGAVVLLEALFAGPICGASMNPARSIAPAVVSMNLEHLWIYILAPIAGAFAAALLWNGIFAPKSEI